MVLQVPLKNFQEPNFNFIMIMIMIKKRKKLISFFQEPNDCNFNFIQIFDGKTDIEHRQKEFCGSIAEPWTSESDVLYLRSGHIYIFIYMQNLKSKFLYILKN